MKSNGIKSIACGLLAFLIMITGCIAIGEQTQKTILFENDLLKITYNGNCTIEDLTEMLPVESLEIGMDFFPYAQLEVVIENKSSIDLAVRLEGGSLNGWSIDPNYASFGYGDVSKNLKQKTTLDLYNTDFLYEVYKAEDLENIQINMVIYEDRKTSLVILDHVSSNIVEIGGDN